MIPTVKEKFETNLSQTHFSIDEKQAGLLISLLRNNIYKNPLLAAIKETLSNSIDEHTKYDIKTPIDICYPNSFVSIISFRDYAKGISKDFMLNEYTKVGLSTKSETNEALGGLGIGRMSPLAYADLFNVTSITNDINGRHKREYIVSKDNNTVFVSFLHEEKTTEETGVCVSFPVKPIDIDKVKEYVFKLTEYVQHVSINLNGVLYTPRDSLFAYKSFRRYKSNSYREIIGLIGGMPNDINLRDFYNYVKNSSEDESIESYLECITSNSCVVFDIPIGFVDQSAEKDIQLTDRTRKNIKLLLKQVVEDHIEFVSNELASFDSIDKVYSFLHKAKVHQLTFTWKNTKFFNCTDWLKDTVYFKITKKGICKVKNKSSSYYTYNYNDKLEFYYNDLEYEVSTTKLKGKIPNLENVVLVNNIDNSLLNLKCLSLFFDKKTTISPRKTAVKKKDNKCYKLSKYDNLGREVNIDLTKECWYISKTFYEEHVDKRNSIRGKILNIFGDVFIVQDVSIVENNWNCVVQHLKNTYKISSNYLLYEKYNRKWYALVDFYEFKNEYKDHIYTKFLEEMDYLRVNYFQGSNYLFIRDLVYEKIITLTDAKVDLDDLNKQLILDYPLFNLSYVAPRGFIIRYIMLEDTFKKNKQVNNEIKEDE